MTHQARLSIVSCLLASFALSACDTDEFADDLPTDIEFRSQTADPSSSSIYNVCATPLTLNNVDTLVRYPKGINCWLPLFDRPLVVVLPGAGFDYTDYAYLLDHLAANGFVAISVDVLASELVENGHDAAATTVVGVIDELLMDWAFGGQIDPTHIALVGHSRGGLTVRYVADQLANPIDDWTVRAIVTLAGKASSQHLIVGDETEALLVLQGGDDADQPPARGYTNYDGADGEIVFNDSTTIDKSMKLLEDGTHSAFTSSGSDQAKVTKGYVLAFLAEHLLGDDFWYEDYIRGDDVPYGWTHRVASQFREHSRLVVDNFEDGSVSNSNIGGGVTVSLGTSATVIDLDSDPDAQHETEALQLGGAANGQFQWTFATHDVSNYASLSLRAGYLDDNGLRGLSVQLRDNGVWSASVSLAGHGTIQQPMEMCIDAGLILACNSFHVFAHMGTIRVPLSAFNVDLDTIDGVRLVMGSKYPSTTFIVDSVEFSGSP